MIDVQEIFAKGIELNASDIHIVEGVRPVFRINRELIEMQGVSPLNVNDIYEVYNFFLKDNEGMKRIFEEEKRLDINYEVNDTRLRVNVSFSNGVPVFTARTIRKELPKFRDLGLPEVVRKNALLPQGLILVTGKSNSGKTTTLNALVNEINQTENKKILMLENPVEYMHTSQKSLIVQKEVGPGKDCISFSSGTINALREDCDILVIGEIRDRSTMDAALELAESGHLVIGTMHTRSCAETIDRVLNFYDLSDQLTIKYMFSSVLRVVVAQRLIKGKENNLVMVPEIMIVDDVVAGLIRKDKFSKSEIEDAIQSRFDKGSISFVNSLANAVNRGQITLEQAKMQLEDSKVENLNRIIAGTRIGFNRF
ncbi:MAG: Flp pilus assembly complex ATPase component TadA [Clostridia bacterium]|nr:Flp pilus assembly complex ATPase component TadA [Clostridia bacterium]